MSGSYGSGSAGGHSGGVGVEMLRAMNQVLGGPLKSANVLESGPGTGHYTVAFLQEGHRVTAIDLSNESVHETRGRASRLGLESGLRTIVGDFASVAESLSEDFDLVTFINVFHHYPDPSTIGEALGVAAARLKPGGSILIFEMNGSNPLWFPRLRARGRERWETEKGYLWMTKSNLTTASQQIKGLTWSRGYRFVIPERFVRRFSQLDGLDRLLCGIPGFRSLAFRLWFLGRKTPSQDP